MGATQRRCSLHHPALANDRALLQALRAGRLRISSISKPLRNQNFSQIRLQLATLDYDQAVAVEQARRLQSSTQIINVACLPLADLWISCAQQRQLPAHGEAALLEDAGRDRFGRRHWLQPVALRALKQLRHVAALDGIPLELISSFRSVRDQLRILMRKQAAGQSWEQILRVNAPPGYSEHHGGCAVDFAIPNQTPLTEAFESSSAYDWLQSSAARFGFTLSYPRDNRWGFIYEPWHWRYQP